MAAAVQSILKYLENNNQDYPMDQNIEIPHQRAKKRRLDHLTWEEKIQRKKLKNRVAAQTSRDRKKAKMEQMENAIQQLFSKNESLMAECESLKLDNQRLSQENQELYNRLRAPCVSCSQNRSVACEAPGSTERRSHAPSSGFDGGHAPHCALRPPTSCTLPDDPADMPTLPDLFDELECAAAQCGATPGNGHAHLSAHVDGAELEQLAQSLLRDIARDLEAAAQKAECHESEGDRQDSDREMVGSPSTQLESGGREVVKQENPTSDVACPADEAPAAESETLVSDISEYLLLHHNYAAKPPTKKQKISQTKFKAIRPKIHKSSTITNPLTPRNKEDNQEIVYGTLDDTANVITIFVDENGQQIDEIITDEVMDELDDNRPSLKDENMLSVTSEYKPSASPASDLGYESLGSPNSIVEDIWDPCVSELFPSLM